MIAVKYSTTYAAKMARIRRLPELLPPVLDSTLKRDAQGVIKEFQQGIIGKTFRLDPLKPKTIERKRATGADHPEYPLYDLGINDPRSYVYMMKLHRVKNGWRVRPSSKMHHSGKIKLKDLFDVHEFGATIKQWKGGQLILIRIPPRPAFFQAFQRHMLKRKKMEPAPAVEVKRAITNYINQGKAETLERIKKKKVLGIIGDLREI